MNMLEKLRDSLKDCAVVDINGYPYFIHPITDGIPSMDPTLLDEIADAVEKTGTMGANLIVTPEAMGIQIAAAVSLRTRIPYSVIRKRKYSLPDEIRMSQHTGYSKTEMYMNGVKRGDRVLILDDVLSTGGTMRSIINAARSVGAEIVGAIVVFGKGDPESIENELGIPIITLLNVKVVDKGVVIC